MDEPLREATGRSPLNRPQGWRILPDYSGSSPAAGISGLVSDRAAVGAGRPTSQQVTVREVHASKPGPREHFDTPSTSMKNVDRVGGARLSSVDDDAHSQGNNSN
jgi:hypothetical protein